MRDVGFLRTKKRINAKLKKLEKPQILQNLQNAVDGKINPTSEKSAATVRNYSITLQQFFNLIPKSISEITIRDIQLWKERLRSRYQTTTASNQRIYLSF